MGNDSTLIHRPCHFIIRLLKTAGMAILFQVHDRGAYQAQKSLPATLSMLKWAHISERKRKRSLSVPRPLHWGRVPRDDKAHRIDEANVLSYIFANNSAFPCKGANQAWCLKNSRWA